MFWNHESFRGGMYSAGLALGLALVSMPAHGTSYPYSAALTVKVLGPVGSDPVIPNATHLRVVFGSTVPFQKSDCTSTGGLLSLGDGAGFSLASLARKNWAPVGGAFLQVCFNRNGKVSDYLLSYTTVSNTSGVTYDKYSIMADPQIGVVETTDHFVNGVDVAQNQDGASSVTWTFRPRP